MTNHDSPLIWEELWIIHTILKRKLVNRIREFKRCKWRWEGTDPINVITGGTTIDLVRRFSTYKRADLIFQDLELLKKIVNNRWMPVQIIFAGKAHPADDDGKRIVQKIYRYAHQQKFGGRIAFVEDYGEQMAQYLVHSVDVWLNNPVPTHGGQRDKSLLKRRPVHECSRRMVA